MGPLSGNVTNPFSILLWDRLPTKLISIITLRKSETESVEIIIATESVHQKYVFCHKEDILTPCEPLISEWGPTFAILVWVRVPIYLTKKNVNRSPGRATSRSRSQPPIPGGREQVTQINVCIANKQMHDKHKDIQIHWNRKQA